MNDTIFKVSSISGFNFSYANNSIFVKDKKPKYSFFNNVIKTKRLHKHIWQKHSVSWYWKQVKLEIKLRRN